MPVTGSRSNRGRRTVTWSASAGATSYTVYRGSACGTALATFADVSSPYSDTSAVARNFEFGKKSRITGTPTLIFINGTRVPGAIDAARLEKLLAEAKP